MKYTNVSKQIMVACAVGIVVICATLVGCEIRERIVPTQNSIMPGTDIYLEPMELRFRTPEQLVQLYANAGKTVPEGYRLKAFLARDVATGQSVIYSPPPVAVDDDVTTSIGHEMLHEALGQYHKEKGK